MVRIGHGWWWLPVVLGSSGSNKKIPWMAHLVKDLGSCQRILALEGLIDAVPKGLQVLLLKWHRYQQIPQAHGWHIEMPDIS